MGEELEGLMDEMREILTLIEEEKNAAYQATTDEQVDDHFQVAADFRVDLEEVAHELLRLLAPARQADE